MKSDAEEVIDINSKLSKLANKLYKEMRTLLYERRRIQFLIDSSYTADNNGCARIAEVLGSQSPEKRKLSSQLALFDLDKRISQLYNSSTRLQAFEKLR